MTFQVLYLNDNDISNVHFLFEGTLLSSHLSVNIYIICTAWFLLSFPHFLIVCSCGLFENNDKISLFVPPR